MVTTDVDTDSVPILELRDMPNPRIHSRGGGPGNYKLYRRGEPIPLGALSTKVGVDLSFISRVFSNTEHERKWIPRLATAAKLSRALDVTLEELHDFLRSLGKSV